MKATRADTATERVSADHGSGSSELEITTEFDCECCGADIERECSAEWPGEAYAQHVETDCPGCRTDCMTDWGIVWMTTENDGRRFGIPIFNTVCAQGVS